MNSNEFSALDGSGLRIAIVASRFHQALCDAMTADAQAALRACGVASDRVTVIRVPGSFELPVAASRLASTEAYDAIVCLGIVLKGETKHDEYIAMAVAQGLTDIAVDTGVPVAFGVLTVNELAQAEVRAKGPQKKGWEAAMSAVETALAIRSIAV